eukprot:4849868-Pyramimonas_sp.AAC.1
MAGARGLWGPRGGHWGRGPQRRLLGHPGGWHGAASTSKSVESELPLHCKRCELSRAALTGASGGRP